MASLYKPAAGVTVTDKATGKTEVSTGSTKYNSELFSFSDSGSSTTTPKTTSSSSSSSIQPTQSPPAVAPASSGAFYIESGTGNQVNSSQLVAGKTYIESGTGRSFVQPGATQPTQQTQTKQPTQQTPAQATQTTQGQTTAQQPTTAQQTAATNPLVMPANGSVVDLLNAAGADSSFAARSLLAQQYGIQNYSGTAAQNTQLAQKYIEAHGSLKGSAVPQNAAEARNSIQAFQEGKDTVAAQDPARQFMDIYGSMNPIEASIFQQLSTLASSVGTKQTLAELYAQEEKDEGITDLKLELADINKIMDGTEDDIREEVEHAGGFATESQVQALVSARNKTLLRQANYLQDTINAKQDYVDRIVSLTQADRAQVSKELDQKLGITQQLLSMTQRMEDSAKDNYKSIVSTIGWDGLAKSMGGSASQIAQVEKMFGLPAGGLNQLAIQEKLYKAENTPTSVVNAGGQVKLINSRTGETIKNLGAPSSGSNSQATFTNTQTNTGAAHAGMSVADFKALPSDVQNVFINNKDAAELIVGDISDVTNGEMNRDDALDDINNASIPQAAKEYFTGLLPAASNKESEGGFWSGIASWFGF